MKEKREKAQAELMKKVAAEGLNNPPQPGVPTRVDEFADDNNIANQSTMHRMDGDLPASSSSVAASSAVDDKGNTGTCKGKRRARVKGKDELPARVKGQRQHVSGQGQRRNASAGQRTGQQRQRTGQQGQQHSGTGDRHRTQQSFQRSRQQQEQQVNLRQRQGVDLRPARSRSPRFKVKASFKHLCCVGVKNGGFTCHHTSFGWPRPRARLWPSGEDCRIRAQ